MFGSKKTKSKSNHEAADIVEEMITKETIRDILTLVAPIDSYCLAPKYLVIGGNILLPGVC